MYFYCTNYWRYYRHWRAGVNNEFYWLSLDQYYRFVEVYSVDAVDGLDMVNFLLLSVDGSFWIRLTVLDLHTLAKCPIFLQLLHCARRTGQMCSNDQFRLPQKWQLRFDSFFFPISVILRFRAGRV